MEAMKNEFWTGSDAKCVKDIAAAKGLTQLSLVLAMLVFAGWTARAGGPALALPGSVTVGEDGSTNVAISVSDTGDSPGNVTIVATSSDTNLVGASGLVISGSGASRTLAITPGAHKAGANTITVIATDSQPLSTTNTIALTVTYTNYPPVFVTSVANQTNLENNGAYSLEFTISDIETPASNLTVTATSSNTTLVPNDDIILFGTGSNRYVAALQMINQYRRSAYRTRRPRRRGRHGDERFSADGFACQSAAQFYDEHQPPQL